MRWFLYGPMTTAVSQALVRHGHSVQDIEAMKLPAEASTEDIIKLANQAQLDILTTDPVLAAAPFAHDLWFQRSLVYLQLAGGDVEQDDAVDRLFDRYKRLTPGRLYTVTGSRVKVRQLPTKK